MFIVMVRSMVVSVVMRVAVVVVVASISMMTAPTVMVVIAISMVMAMTVHMPAVMATALVPHGSANAERENATSTQLRQHCAAGYGFALAGYFHSHLPGLTLYINQT